MGRVGNYLSLTRSSCDGAKLRFRRSSWTRKCGFLPGVRVFIIFWGVPKDTRRHYTAGRTRLLNLESCQLDPPHPPSAARTAPRFSSRRARCRLEARVSPHFPRYLFSPRPACFSKSQRMLCRVPIAALQRARRDTCVQYIRNCSFWLVVVGNDGAEW